MSSMLYEFTNKEGDRIHQAFRVGNYVSIRDLPDSLVPGNVSYMQTSKMEDNLQSVMERKTYVELAGNGGYFSKFPYSYNEEYDSYDSYKEDMRKRREAHEEKMMKIGGGAPFLNMPNRALPHKHESYFRSLMF